MTVLPETLQCREFVNCDEMAKGLNPLNPDSAKITAARLMLSRIKKLISLDEDFAIETTLATKSYHALVQKAQEKGYDIKLIYFWLQSPELALQRVAERVKNGGHNVEEHIVRRRYTAGVRNLFKYQTDMTTVKVNAKKNEVSELTKQLMTGLDLSFRRLVIMRSRHNGTMCFCDEKGRIYTVRAKDVKTMMGA